jgi:hypothetical protein
LVRFVRSFVIQNIVPLTDAVISVVDISKLDSSPNFVAFVQIVHACKNNFTFETKLFSLGKSRSLRIKVVQFVIIEVDQSEKYKFIQVPVLFSIVSPDLYTFQVSSCTINNFSSGL